MRAAVFNGVGRPLTIERIRDPIAGPGEVILRVERCGICTSDLHLTEEHDLTLPVGAVPGHEFSGEVMECGAGVAGLRPGDRVTALPLMSCGDCPSCQAGDPRQCPKVRSTAGGRTDAPGAYAEYIRTTASSCFRLPNHVSFAQGAMVEPMAAAKHGSDMAGIRMGERVLVLGAGPIGLACVFWAKQAGASVAVAATSRRKASIADAMGADHFLTLPVDGSLGDEAVEALGGAPTVVLECVGAAGVLDQAIGAVARHGVIVSLGFCIGEDRFNPAAAYWKEVTIRFSISWIVSDFMASIRQLEQRIAAPEVMITQTVSLEALPDMFELLRAGTHHCKVMVAPH
jgi:(R,R)-butanediol dehydrogenase / meso-butanediol dehydrogenase / diacetyl reductase